jgi:hypothetical protein
MSETHQTHLNVFREDVEKAHRAAAAAVDDLKTAVDLLVAKYESLMRDKPDEDTAIPGKSTKSRKDT